MLPLERVVIPDNTGRLRSVLVRDGSTVCQVAERRERLLHVEDVAVDVHALR